MSPYSTDRLTILSRLSDWLWGRKLMVHEEITVRYRAIRGKSVQDYEVAILEELYKDSTK